MLNYYKVIPNYFQRILYRFLKTKSISGENLGSLCQLKLCFVIRWYPSWYAYQYVAQLHQDYLYWHFSGFALCYAILFVLMSICNFINQNYFKTTNRFFYINWKSKWISCKIGTDIYSLHQTSSQVIFVILAIWFHAIQYHHLLYHQVVHLF